MSQVSIIDIEGNFPQIPTTFITNSGNAIPIINQLELLGEVVVSGTTPFASVGAGNVVTYQVQISQAIAATDATRVGLAAFNSAHFTVDANGFVSSLGGGGGGLSDFATDINSPVVPDGGGTVNITGGQVFSNGSIANTLRLAVEATENTFLLGAGGNVAMTELGPLADGQVIIGSTGGAPVATTITAGNGVTVTNLPGAISIAVSPSVGLTITGTSGGAISPTLNNWNLLGSVAVAGTAPLVVAGAGSTLTITSQRSQALAATDVTKIGLANFNSADFTVDANGFVSLIGGGGGISDFTTDVAGPVVPDGGGSVDITGTHVFSNGTVLNTLTLDVDATLNTFLVGAGNNTAMTELGPLTNGQVIIGQTAGAPVAGNITGSGGVVVTNGAGTIALSLNTAVVGQTITGDNATPLSPTAGNWNIVGTTAQGITSSGAGSTLTFTVANASEAQKGVVLLASNAETIAGNETTKAVTPDDLKAKLGTQTQYAIAVGNGTSMALDWKGPMTNGQVLIGSTGVTPVVANLSAGSNIQITNGAGSISIAATNIFTWNSVAGTSQSAVANNGYYCVNAATTTVTLPTSVAAGSIIRVAGYGSGGWIINYGTGQLIHFLSVNTTTTTGTLFSTNRYDSVELLCTVANTEFNVLQVTGNVDYS